MVKARLLRKMRNQRMMLSALTANNSYLGVKLSLTQYHVIGIPQNVKSVVKLYIRLRRKST